MPGSGHGLADSASSHGHRPNLACSLVMCNIFNWKNCTYYMHPFVHRIRTFHQLVIVAHFSIHSTQSPQSRSHVRTYPVMSLVRIRGLYSLAGINLVRSTVFTSHPSLSVSLSQAGARVVLYLGFESSARAIRVSKLCRNREKRSARMLLSFNVGANALQYPVFRFQ